MNANATLFSSNWLTLGHCFEPNTVYIGANITCIHSILRSPLGLGREHIWVYSYLKERWSYVCLPSEVGNLI